MERRSIFQRQNLYVSVLSAIALAGVDVVRSAPAPLDWKELHAAITKQADNTYAMPVDQAWVKAAASDLADLIVQCPFDQWSQLQGPFWKLWHPQPINPIITGSDDRKFPFVIDDMNRIVIV